MSGAGLARAAAALATATLATATLAAALAWAGSAAAADLTMGQGAPATSADPHFYNAAPNNGLAMHLFDRLTERGPKADLMPGLAVSWKPVGDTVWEFKLRPNVTWQDGKPFTPDDVAFTVGRAGNVPNSPGGFAAMVRGVVRAEIVDPTTIRLHTAVPAPNLPGDMASVAIVSRHAGEGASTEDYNSGKAAIGTGPYKLVRYAAGDRVDLVRNEAWWGPRPAWDRVSIRFIANPGAREAALLAGDVDMIDVPPPPDIAKLKANPDLSVVSIQGQRTIYLGPDGSRSGEEPFITGNDGKPLPKNPMRDVRVRRALSIAINRQAISDRIMQGTALPTGQWLTPGAFGYVPDIKPPAYDTEGARALLAEAGYPQGFHLTLHTPNDRYPNDAAIAQAIAQMWTRIGVATAVEALPWSTYSIRGAHQEFSIGLWGWGTTTVEATYALINIMGTFDRETGFGMQNHYRYSNPALDALTRRASSTLDNAEREKLDQEAVRLAMDDVAIIPIQQLVNSWATRKAIVYQPRADERSLAMNAVPAQ